MKPAQTQLKKAILQKYVMLTLHENIEGYSSWIWKTFNNPFIPHKEGPSMIKQAIDYINAAIDGIYSKG